MGPILLSAQLLDILKSPENVDEGARYQVIFKRLQLAILQGELVGGTRLPATRELSSALGVARNTVKTAYEMLVAEGYVETVTGSGSYVAHLPESVLRNKPSKTKQDPGLSVSEYAKQFLGFTPLNPDTRKLLQPGIPAVDQFPIEQWKRCLARAASFKSLDSSPPAGDLRLREQISKYLLRHRGIEAKPDQILVTSGSQQAIYMVAQLLTNSGDRVVVETPGFPGISGAFKVAGCNIDAVQFPLINPLKGKAALLSLTPSRNFPLGHTISLAERLEVIRWAETEGAWILEDDYDSEFAIGHSVSSLFAISDYQRVIYTGTFSRSMFPAIRLGYVVLPELLVHLFNRARRYMDGGLSGVTQVAMAEFMEQGYFARHMKKMNGLYQKRLSVLSQEVEVSCLSDLPILGAEGGMHLVLGLPDQIEDKRLVEQLKKDGLGVRALSGYTQEGPKLNGLVIGYCAESEEQIRQGVQLIGKHYKNVRSHSKLG